MLQLMNKCKF